MIHVVVGHICSGKSTWVRERAGPDDVVIDHDLIARALSSNSAGHHGHTAQVGEIDQTPGVGKNTKTK